MITNIVNSKFSDISLSLKEYIRKCNNEYVNKKLKECTKLGNYTLSITYNNFKPTYIYFSSFLFFLSITRFGKYFIKFKK